MKIRTRLATGCVVMLAACATSGGSGDTPEFPPRPADHTIAVLEAQPECPFLELGEVSARPHTEFSTRENVMEELREAARELGGDALVDLREDDRRRSPNQGRIVLPGTAPPPQSSNAARVSALTASVIRFVEPDCRS